MSQPTRERLDSWKEIAEYLRRDLRTVRRWEKTRELPIHRVPGGGRSAVYALRSEIDAWLSGTATPVDILSERGEGIDPIDGIQTRNRAEDFQDESVTSDDLVRPAITDSNQAVKAQGLAPRWRFAIVTAVTIAFVATLSTPLVWRNKERVVSSAAGPEAPPKINSVSPILPQRDQTIVIKGVGFGLHTAYKNADIPFLAIRDKTTHWAAGRIIPQNWDEVTLNVESWQDAQIVISGFSGAYGSGEWKLDKGDEIEIAVWNPQSGHGPAIYHLIVSGSPAK
jgi:hypothetical protein